MLTYDRGKKHWQDFSRFKVPGKDRKASAPRLRDWHSPIMAGNAELVQYLARYAKHGNLLQKVKGVFGGSS